MPVDALAPSEIDLLLIGGGLANGLLALRLSQLRPELNVVIVEAGDTLGGVHTWSFFDTDLTDAQKAWIAPLVAHRWSGYDVRFPAHARRLPTGYCSVTSERFHQVVSGAVRSVIHGVVEATAPDGVTLRDGRRLAARAVIDGRGPIATPDLALGFQKFVGLEVRTREPHGLDRPVVMDARVSQDGGYRFVYVLPFDARTLLIEDTRYTDGAALDRDAFRRGVRDYACAQGWEIDAVVREEEGVLPVALDGDLAAHFRRHGTTPMIGLRAGLFHPTTGYALPDAVRLADAICADRTAGPQGLARGIRKHALDVWNRRRFYRLLNRMLFRAAEPRQRYRILERFYRLPTPLIERFYAGRSTLADRVRVLSGRPPVPLCAALGCLIEKGRA